MYHAILLFVIQLVKKKKEAIITKKIIKCPIYEKSSLVT